MEWLMVLRGVGRFVAFDVVDGFTLTLVDDIIINIYVR